MLLRLKKDAKGCAVDGRSLEESDSFQNVS